MLKIIVSLFLIISLSGCATSIEEPESFENEVESAHYVVEALQESQPEKILPLISEEVKDFVTAEGLQERWDGVSKDIGTIQDIEILDFTETIPGLIQVLIYGENMKGNISLRYDEEGKITNINLLSRPNEPENQSNEWLEEVSIRTGFNESLSGKLTLPKGVENPPVVILIQGSGPSDMNSEVYALKPFEDIAHGLAQQGIASIRYDKRYYAYPYWVNGVKDISLAWEYLYDVEAVIDQVKDFPVDENQIYLLGHSQGAMLAPRIAYENEEIRGIICLAGSPRGLEEIIRDQNENALIDMGMDEKQIETLLMGLDEEIEMIQSINENTEEAIYNNLPSGYWFEMNQSKAEKFIGQLTSDVLILNAEEDWQVSIEKDYEAWKELVEGLSYVQLKSYPNLNHMMSLSTADGFADYEEAKPVAEEVINDIVTWVKDRTIAGGEK